MRIWEVIMIGAMSAVDGFFVALAFGLRGVRLRGMRLFWMAFWTLPASLGAVMLARLFGRYISVGVAKGLGGGLLIAAGLLSLLECVRGKKPEIPLSVTGACMLGLGLAMDGTAAAFSLGLQGAPVLQTGAVFLLCQLLLLVAGNRLGRVGRFASEKIQYLPSIVLMLLGIWKLLPI